MEQYYTDERNVQILISLLKQNNIHKVVVSPGSTNVTFVASLQYDGSFEMYSCVDERSAAYMACGLAVESGEPVVLSCTGATASRNYFPALTEAYYRQIPILAVTSTQDEALIGTLTPQVIDRSQQPKDTVRCSVHLQNIKDEIDERDVTLKANKAILELDHHGKGPVHINLSTRYSADFSVKELPVARKIDRLNVLSSIPEIIGKRVAIFCGSHHRWSEEETSLVDSFCEIYDSVVFCDYTSNYKGKYGVCYELVNAQKIPHDNNVDILIHIGNMSDQFCIGGNTKTVWRVSEDGQLVDKMGRLSKVFEMPESEFFKRYTINKKNKCIGFFEKCQSDVSRIISQIPDLPFSHIWIASQMSQKIPNDSVVHLGILSPLRSWSYFEMDKSIEIYCNQGGFGIDGNLSSMLGGALAFPNKLHYGIVGDLSFFYDMNIIGNRHVRNNVRILLINNSLGAEFHLFKQRNSIYVNNIEGYLSAGNHFGHQSMNLVKHYAQDLGFEYLAANNKEEFLSNMERFITAEPTTKPMIFEVFTNVDDENEALKRMWNIERNITLKQQVVSTVKGIVGKSNIEKIKKVKDALK